MTLKLKDFDYYLPKELIAQEPALKRDRSRLLGLSKKTGEIEHELFCNILKYLKSGDCLVLNNSKVFPARLVGEKAKTKGRAEIFLLEFPSSKKSSFNCLAKGGGLKQGLKINLAKNLQAEILAKNIDNTWQIKFSQKGEKLIKIIQKIGLIPLPPYIKRSQRSASDKKNYQTVYAEEGKLGSVAAPTAGLHFTKALLKKIKAQGVEIVYLTLHVGLGTFLPVKTENIAEHKMHAEWVEIGEAAARAIVRAKQEKRRVVAVGSTSVRALEAIIAPKIKMPIEKIKKIQDKINIFIYPPFKFRVIDAMITNFHLPKSTLLMMISAFAGLEKIKQAYREAIQEKYRFFSYGDAMFIF